MSTWTPEQQADSDASCAVLTGIRKTLRGVSTGNAAPKPHDLETVRGARLSLMGAAHFVGTAARSWAMSGTAVAGLEIKAGRIADDLAEWVAADKPRRVNLRKIFARYEQLHDVIIAIGESDDAPTPRGEGGGDGSGK